MKHLMIALVAALTLAGYAEEKKQLTPEEPAAKRQRWYQKTGGHVTKPGEGKLLIINGQSKISDDLIEIQRGNLADLLFINVETVKGSWKMGDPLPKDATLAIYLVDDPTLPPSLIAPEARWGLVNCAELAEKRRFNKIFVRVAVGMFDGSSSQIDTNLMHPITKLSDVDSIVNEAVPFDSTMKMAKNVKGYGFVQSRMRTYRMACQEGWAPTPTNDVQKAIWDEIHALPDKPIKIKFDPKTAK